MRINREKERGGEAKQGPVGATFGPPALHDARVPVDPTASKS